jgi:hypothetical protein
VRSIRHSLIIPVAVILLACFGSNVGASPPPHAPANGYRYQHPADHVVLVFNSGLSLYVVSGYPNYYFFSGSYYRVSGDTWYRAPRVGGPWIVVSYASIPSGLHQKYKDPGHGHESPGHGHESHKGHEHH